MLGKRRISAFTLIEVLVVVAIIALLIAILLPSLNQSRQQARSVNCKAHVRQLGFGMMYYLHDFRVFPAHQWRIPHPDYPDDKRVRWYNVMAKYLAGFKVQSCPAVPDWEVGRNNSYGYNYKYLGSARDNNISPTHPWENFPVKTVRRPAETIAFGDCDGTGWTKPYQRGVNDKEMLGNHGYTMDPTFIPEYTLQSFSGPDLEPYAWKNYRTYISDRHLGKSNLCFCDGHVEAMTARQVYQDNRYWNGLGCEDPQRDRHVSYRHDPTSTPEFRYKL